MKLSPPKIAPDLSPAPPDAEGLVPSPKAAPALVKPTPKPIVPKEVVPKEDYTWPPDLYE